MKKEIYSGGLLGFDLYKLLDLWQEAIYCREGDSNFTSFYVYFFSQPGVVLTHVKQVPEKSSPLEILTLHGEEDRVCQVEAAILRVIEQERQDSQRRMELQRELAELRLK